MESSIKVGSDKDATISAVLSYNPSRTDDGAVFRCVVWNRAMPEGSKLEAKTTLSVNCKCLLITMLSLFLNSCTIWNRLLYSWSLIFNMKVLNISH